jgi:hypothetical protein
MPEREKGLNTQKLINVKCHINRKKDKNHMMISLNAESI